jgi:two-component system chemotaxis response regulator CheB
MLRAAIALTNDIEVVGTAPDPLVARQKIKQLNPDVLTLDVEMPKMDGITFLSNLMRLRPMPVVMVSTMTMKGSEVTFDALELGAVDYIPKPNANLVGDLAEFTLEVQEKIRVAASARINPLSEWTRSRIADKKKDHLLREAVVVKNYNNLIAIGASTGGPNAIKEVLSALPASCPPVVVTQHMPPGFTASFAQRLDKTCSIRVVEACNNDPILPGIAYLAPGDQHLQIKGAPGKYICRLHSRAKVSGHRPSVDVLFDSASKVASPEAIGVLLTGMGSDGAEGMLQMRRSGCHTVVQDELTSVVWGMPGSAVRNNAVQDILPLDKIGPAIMRSASKTGRGG